MEGDAASASRARIARGAKSWKAVLGVAAAADAEDVKKAYRKLVLLHHPDKPGGDVDTFRLVHQAYALGLKKCRKTVPTQPSEGIAKPAQGAAVSRNSPRKRKAAATDPVMTAWLRKAFVASSEAKPQASTASSDEGCSPRPSPAERATPAKATTARAKAKGKAKGKAKAQSKAAAAAAAAQPPPAAAGGRASVVAPAARRAAAGSPAQRSAEAPAARPAWADAAPPSPRAAPRAVTSPRDALRRAAAAAAAAEAAEERASKRPARPRPWVLAEGAVAAGKAKVLKALSAWESTSIDGARTRPCDISWVPPGELAEHLRAASWVAVDVRDTCAGVEIQGAERVSFSDFFNSPEGLLPGISKLKDDSRHLVLFSEQGEQMSTCGLVAAALQDVFSFNASRISRLSGGYAAWSRFLDDNPSVARFVEPLSARLARRRATAAAAAAAAAAEGDGIKADASDATFSDLCKQNGGG